MSTDPDKNRAAASNSAADSREQDRLAELESQVEAYRRSLAEMYERYDQKIEELSLIRRVGDAVRTTFDLETLCRRVTAAVAQEVPADGLHLFVTGPAAGRLTLCASFEAETDEVRLIAPEEAPALDAETGDAALALASALPRLTQGAPDPLTGATSPEASRVFLPLVVRDRPAGLFLLSRFGPPGFTEEDLRILTIIADQAAGALANLTLVSELSQANARLSASERQARQTSLYLERLLDTAGDVIFTLDAFGRVTYVNGRGAAWGYDRDNLVGRSFGDLAVDRAQGEALLQDIVQRRRPEIETLLVTASGERLEVYLTASALDKGPDDETVFLVLARDETARKALERQLFHSEKLASIGILAAGVAHEIGNPLSAITGYTEIIQGGIRPEDLEKHVEAIAQQAARIEKIIQDLLHFSRPAEGLSARIKVDETARSVVSMLLNQRAFRGVEVEYDFAPDLPEVEMDPDHLAQVLINIVLNAAQAMGLTGQVRISGRGQGSGLALTIADNGPGIPAEIQPRIFDPFFTTKSAGQGTGLGLAICHRIVEKYGGRLDFESEPGRGTSFRITLPAAGRERN